MSDIARLIERTRRIPRLTAAATSGEGAVVARQLDAVLATGGFACSRDVIDNLSAAAHGEAMDRAVAVIAAARHLVGDHVRHNAYFRDFPFGVPDTVEFWARCLHDAIMVGATATPALLDVVNLLALPTYGRYQHTFEELAAAHDELIAVAGDRITVLHLGGTPEEETRRALRELAGSTTPLTPGDRELLGELIGVAGDREFGDVPVRENRAIIDAARLGHSLPLALTSTVTDVLRVAALASGADVALTEAPKFTSLRRGQRRLLLAALDRIVQDAPSALGDVPPRAEVWKRLGERLHPHEYPQFVHAAQVFQVARGEREARSLASQAEATATVDPVVTARLLATAPGVLARWTDRLLRSCAPGSDAQAAVLVEFETAAPRMSGRALLSLRDHLDNRTSTAAPRLFVNRRGRAHVEPDQRAALDPAAAATLRDIIDGEITSRLPAIAHLVIDPAVLDASLPLSGKATADGFAILPRGTTTPLPAGDSLRFFTYWRETEQRTDFDLSLLMLDHRFQYAGQVSWTGLRDGVVVHSGDITESHNGATEFIDVLLPDVHANYLIPQVNIYSGEGFDQVTESLFGWMVRDRSQRGMPFEPRTVRARSELRGPGRVALPAVFHRGDDGWKVTWLHLNLRGNPNFNMVEGNKVSTTDLTRAILDRRYLTVRYLLDMMAAKAGKVTALGDVIASDSPVTYIGLERPEGLPAESDVITLDNLNHLIPR